MTAARKGRARKVRVGLTLEQYQSLLALQGGGCAICKATPKTRRLDVDHDHKTGEIRGLLCHWCNRTLGPRITVDWMRRASMYLERPPAGPPTDVIRCRYCGEPGAVVCDAHHPLARIEHYEGGDPTCPL